MTCIDPTKHREHQRDARAWAAFTGTNYTAALRQMESPLTQGILGARVSARHLIATLDNHELIGAHGGQPALGDSGFLSQEPWRFDGKTDFTELALATEVLRMFAPLSANEAPEVNSYSLKHTAEHFLDEHFHHVYNGRLIWAAAALGLPMAAPDGEGPNLLIGVPEREHHYVARAVRYGGVKPGVDHHRPAGFDYLQSALAQVAAGEPVTAGWVRPTSVDEPAPFHDWLAGQVDRGDAVSDLAGDYVAGVRDSDHGIARAAGDLLAILHEARASSEAYDAAVRAIAEWMAATPAADPVRTERIDASSHDHEGWGAGAGTVERLEYRCPCGDGTIVEEHDNIPGFQEHDVKIDCGRCFAQWRFVDDRSKRGWGLEPIAVGPAV